MIRPRLRALLRRWREPLLAGSALVLGLWLATRGGWFFALLGGVCALIGAVLFLGAVRRLAFLRNITAPGYVQLDEGVIRYFGARTLGGEAALRDLTQVQLLPLKGRVYWRLKSQNGEALLIPVDAAGAAVMADALAILPGLDMSVISAALTHPDWGDPMPKTVWHRPVELT